MSIVVDCTSTPSVDALRAAGISGVTRYLSWLPNPKVITTAELNRLTSGGISVMLNWEYSARDWMAGGTAGKLHATEAVHQAKTLGYPQGCSIVGSADFDMSAGDWAQAGQAYSVAFAAGIRSGGYLPGVYGPWDVLARCKALGGFAIFWQAGMSTSWSGGRNAQRWPGAHLRQLRGGTVGGVSVDFNEVLTAEYGQYQPWNTRLPEDPMQTLVLVRKVGTTQVWLSNMVTRRAVPTADVSAVQSWISANHLAAGAADIVDVSNVAPFGTDVATLAAPAVDPAQLAALLAAKMPTAAQVAAALIDQLRPGG